MVFNLSIFYFTAWHLDMFTVYIDDVECGKVTTDHPVSGGSKTVWCDPPLNGTKLRIQKDEDDHLVLAEVVPIFNCH